MNIMTDQNYKLVPCPITNKMIERAGRAYDRAGNKPTVGTFLDAIEKAIEAAIAAAPEPVCRWRDSTGSGEWRTDCGRQAGWCPQPEWRFCPYCGNRVEMMEGRNE